MFELTDLGKFKINLFIHIFTHLEIENLRDCFFLHEVAIDLPFYFACIYIHEMIGKQFNCLYLIHVRMERAAVDH